MTADARDADRLLGDISESDRLVVVIGIDGSVPIGALTDAPPSTRFLAIEPRPEIAEVVLTRSPWKEWLESSRLIALVGPDFDGSAEAARRLGRVAGEPAGLMSPALRAGAPDAARRAARVAHGVIAGIRENETARRRFAGPYLRNTILNLPIVVAEGDAAALNGLFPGLPAVVVGAGPSLDRNVGELRALQDRALVIAVDTAARPLLAAGVRPHVVVSVDPSEQNARHLLGLGAADDFWFVAEGSIDPEVMAQFGGRTFTFHVSQHEPWPWLAAHGTSRGQLRAWGSVLTTAFDLALGAGCDPIVFAGADLAYTNGLLYCRNTVYEADWREVPTDEDRARLFATGHLANTPTCRTPGVEDEPVLSAPRFLQFRDWIVAQAKAHAGRRVMNATGAGILHGESVVQTDLAAVLASAPVLADDDAPRARLLQAWRSSSRGAAAPDLAAALDAAVRGVAPEEASVARWVAFTEDTMSPAEIERYTGVVSRALVRGWQGTVWTTELEALLHDPKKRRHQMAQLEAALQERDAARTQRDAALGERDRALGDRDAARLERDAAVGAFQGHYHHWRMVRIRKLLDLWGAEAFRGARLLELGCGYGDIGAFFLALGADVTFSDARPEHLEVVRSRYPGARTVVHDANEPFPGNGFDVVIHMGLLYHLRPDAVAPAILNACALGRRVVLETEVCDSADPLGFVQTSEAGLDQAIDGIGCRPSALYIERVLEAGGTRWTRHDDAALNTGLHVYDWTTRNDGRHFDPLAAHRDAAALQVALRRFYTIERD